MEDKCQPFIWHSFGMKKKRTYRQFYIQVNSAVTIKTQLGQNNEKPTDTPSKAPYRQDTKYSGTDKNTVKNNTIF